MLHILPHIQVLEFSYSKCTIWVSNYLKQGLPDRGDPPLLLSFLMLSSPIPSQNFRKKKVKKRKPILAFHICKKFLFDFSLQIKTSFKKHIELQVVNLASFKCLVSVLVPVLKNSTGDKSQTPQYLTLCCPQSQKRQFIELHIST